MIGIVEMAVMVIRTVLGVIRTPSASRPSAMAEAVRWAS